MVKLLRVLTVGNMRKVLCYLFWLTSILSFDVLAHQMKQHTSQITVRDGQVEVLMHLDSHKWLAKLADHHSWLLGDTETVIDTALEPEEKANRLEQLLNKEMSLSVNGKGVILKVDKLTYYDSLLHLRVLASASISVPSTKVSRVTVKYPKSLGAVYTSVIKPQFKLVTADKTVEFRLN